MQSMTHVVMLVGLLLLQGILLLKGVCSFCVVGRG